MKKLNVGCNNVLLDGWDNLDIHDIPGVIQHNATHIFPYEDNSVDFIYSEHFIEHLNDTDGIFYFTECYRMLKPGGVVRTSTFDIDDLLINLQEKNWKTYSEWLYDGVFRDKTRIEFFNLAVFEGNAHKYMYNPDEMIRFLQKSGFSKFKTPEMKVSSYSELQNLEWRCNSNCIVEAIK